MNQEVHNVAEEVNQDGLRCQLEFLEKLLGPKQAADTIYRVMAQEDEIGKLASEVAAEDRLGQLLRVVYDQKMREAHELAHARTRNILRYLVQRLGVDNVRKLIRSYHQ